MYHVADSLSAVIKWILTEPKTTAPVYLIGNFAAIPNTEFW